MTNETTNRRPLKATALNGDEWSGETEFENGVKWFLYFSSEGWPYASREVPAYRMRLDNATQVLVNGKNDDCTDQ